MKGKEGKGMKKRKGKKEGEGKKEKKIENKWKEREENGRNKREKREEKKEEGRTGMQDGVSQLMEGKGRGATGQTSSEWPARSIRRTLLVCTGRCNKGIGVSFSASLGTAFQVCVGSVCTAPAW